MPREAESESWTQGLVSWQRWSLCGLSKMLPLFLELRNLITPQALKHYTRLPPGGSGSLLHWHAVRHSDCLLLPLCIHHLTSSVSKLASCSPQLAVPLSLCLPVTHKSALTLCLCLCPSLSLSLLIYLLIYLSLNLCLHKSIQLCS